MSIKALKAKYSPKTRKLRATLAAQEQQLKQLNAAVAALQGTITATSRPVRVKDLRQVAQVTLPRDISPGVQYQTSPNQFALDVGGPPGGLECDENEFSIILNYADGSRRDGVGDLLDVEGIRTERHILNPLVLWEHSQIVKLPIGVSECPKTGQYLNFIDPAARTAKLKAFLYQGKKPASPDRELDYQHAVFCEQLFDLVAKKFLRGGSLGYQILSADYLGPDPASGVQKGLHLRSVLMLEASLVCLPANMDTVGKMLGMTSCCGRPLSKWLVKSLSPYALPRKAQLGCEGKKQDGHILGVDVRDYDNVPSADYQPGPGARSAKPTGGGPRTMKAIRAKYKKQAMRPEEEKYRSVQVGPQVHESDSCSCGGACDKCNTEHHVKMTTKKDSMGRTYCTQTGHGKVPCNNAEEPTQGRTPKAPPLAPEPKPPTSPRAATNTRSDYAPMPQFEGSRNDVTDGTLQAQHHGELPEDLPVSEQCRLDGVCSDEEKAIIEKFQTLRDREEKLFNRRKALIEEPLKSWEPWKDRQVALEKVEDEITDVVREQKWLIARAVGAD